MTLREQALEQVLNCDDLSDVLYYIETLESVIKHLAAGEAEETENEREVLAIVVTIPRILR